MHTPAEIGFWADPKTLAFANQVKNPDAGAWILRLREFVLCHGTHDGRLPGYSLDEIVAVIRPTCATRVLLEALKRRRYLCLRRKTWFVPDWARSQAGHYCELRRKGRERKEEWREKQHQAHLEELDGSGGTERGRNGDVRVPDRGHSGSSNKGQNGDVPSPPPGAPRRGVKARAARWEWFEQNYLKISDPEKCRRLLEQLTEQEWDHLCYAVPKQMARYRFERERKFCPGAPKYLREKRFLEIRLPNAAELKAEKHATEKRAEKPAAPPTKDQVKAEKWKFLAQYLADPDWSEHEKQRKKADWFKLWGDKPWEKGKAA